METIVNWIISKAKAVAAWIVNDPGLIKLTKEQRIAAALMVNDAIDYAARIEALNNQMREHMEQAETILATAEADNRELTQDEDNQHQAILSNFRKLRAEANRMQEMQDNAEFMRGSADPSARPSPNVPDPQNGLVNQHPNQTGANRERSDRVQIIENSAAHGFRHFGEFARAVRNGSAKNAAVGNIDPRLLVNAPTSFSQEGVGADGGFLVPPEYSQAIMRQVMGEDTLLSMCDELQTARNSIAIPQDVTTPYGTSGIQAYWEGEAAQYTQSKPQFKLKQERLSKLTALVPVDEEMLEDAPLIGSYLNLKAPEVMTSKVNDAIINGTGAGQPLGFMNSGALITVAKETSQVADTIVAENIDKMWSRMRAKFWRNAVWLINQDIMPELDNMVRLVKNVAGTENVGGVPAYMPPNGLSASPYGTLKGRPVIPVEGMQTLGDLGDIALVDLSQYMAATKAGGIRSDVSVHLWFDYDVTAFKFRFRLAGSPWFDSAVTPKNSTNTLSPFVTLAARA